MACLAFSLDGTVIVMAVAYTGLRAFGAPREAGRGAVVADTP